MPSTACWWPTEPFGRPELGRARAARPHLTRSAAISAFYATLLPIDFPSDGLGRALWGSVSETSTHPDALRKKKVGRFGSAVAHPLSS